MPVHRLSDLPERNLSPQPWLDVKSSLPWGDPEFSKRMLREHLDPSHDKASRRPIIRSGEIAWTLEKLLTPRNVKTVLDLTCGPGLWANELARHGLIVRGIDISPSAIDYARKTAREENLPATFLQGDIREVPFGSGYDAAIFLYAEANAFKWEEFAQVLLRIEDSLKPGGILLLELSPPDAMARMAGSSWYTAPSGLYGDFPYLALTEWFYDSDNRTACARHYAVDIASNKVKEYGVSYQCYTSRDLSLLLDVCGLDLLEEYDSLTGQKGLENPDWHVVVAERPVKET
jgi:SAM-dependent methyltransferase